MEYKNVPRQNTRYPQWSQYFPSAVWKSFPNRVEASSPVNSGSLSPVEYKITLPSQVQNIIPSRILRIIPAKSNKVIPSKSQLKDHPQRSSSLSQNRNSILNGLSIISNGNPSPIEFISGVLSRASLPHIVISSSVYSPMELSSPTGLFSQSHSFIIPSGNEEFNSILQRLSEIYFPS